MEIWILLCAAVLGLAAGQESPQGAGPALLSDADVSLQKWAATAAILSLQTTGGNEEAALLTLDTLEKLTLQAINDAANGRPEAALERVINDATNVDLPANATDALERLQNIPTGGVPSFVGPARIGNATTFFNGLLVVSDPRLFADSSSKLQQSALGAILAATGINYSPCLAVLGPVGAALFAQAISIGPTLIQTSSSGGALVSIGVNIGPTLINIGVADSANIAAGVSITPTLISVAPVLEAADIKTGVSVDSTPLESVKIPRPWPEPPPAPPRKNPPDPPEPPKPSQPPQPPQPGPTVQP